MEINKIATGEVLLVIIYYGNYLSSKVVWLDASNTARMADLRKGKS